MIAHPWTIANRAITLWLERELAGKRVLWYRPAEQSGDVRRVKARHFVDLFAGCGGLSLGLEQAGFTPVLVNELSLDAMETYLVNRDQRYPYLRRTYHVQNVEELITNQFEKLSWFANQFRTDFGFNIAAGELDLLVGGPPCQGFSRIGHRRTHASDRLDIPSNHLYVKMVQAIAFLRPKLFIFENVLGLRSARWTPDGTKGEIWSDVHATFMSLDGYHVHPQTVQAYDYGVPQNRPRVLIVGIRDDVQFSRCELLPAHGLLPLPIGDPPDLVDVLSDLVDPAYANGGDTPQYPQSPTTSIQRFLRTNPVTGQVSEEGDLLTDHKYSRHSTEVTGRFASMIASGGTIPSNLQTKKFSQRVLPARWGIGGPNITVTSLPDDYVHYLQPRTPTVREWARMQTFPDWYVFRGPRTTGSEKRAGHPSNGLLEREVPKYTQIGNAVPVAMARELGSHFNKILNDDTQA